MGYSKEDILERSEASQAASTAVRSEFKKLVELQMHLTSVSAHPLEPRAVTAGVSWRTGISTKSYRVTQRDSLTAQVGI
jgi:hypothetical protein